MAHYLYGRRFNELQQVEIAIKEFFASKSKDWNATGMRQLAERWMKTIEHEGMYFDC